MTYYLLISTESENYHAYASRAVYSDETKQWTLYDVTLYVHGEELQLDQLDVHKADVVISGERKEPPTPRPQYPDDWGWADR